LELEAGCNFAATIVLCSVISGTSRIIYPRKGSDADQFKTLVATYFPWEEEPNPGLRCEEAADVLYEEFRNPLIHAAGLPVELKGSKQTKVSVIRYDLKEPNVTKYRGIVEAKIQELEVSRSRPISWGPTITTDREGRKSKILVEGLYWGVREMICRLTHVPKIMEESSQLLRSGLEPAQNPDGNTRRHYSAGSSEAEVVSVIMPDKKT